ncbi:hypothetical protein ZIOFF_035063 [Zingiber officinale]|uniref:DUF4220 domain-containing protein n=1 Tax=Zingiber officinale TaxID=94328 RepID=A0A8J5GAJ9_ZINOF|nr:hypothetical protein ZIOFF_035063 [Zingiber officinale]
MGVSNTAGTLAGIVGVGLTGRILEGAKSADMDLTSIECFGLKLLSCTKIQDIKHAVLAAVIKAGAAREHEILAEIRDAVFSFIRKIEPKKVMDTMLVSRVRILYIRSLLARSPELQLIKVSSVERFLEKANDGHSRCSSCGSSPSRSLVHYDSVHGFKLREITEEAKPFVIGNEALAALFVHTPAGELQCQIRSWLAENYDFLSVVGADSISGNSTSQLELLSTAIMDGWMAGLGTAQFPSTDALGQLLSEYTKRVYSSQLQHLKVVGLINPSRHGEPDDSEGAIRPGGPIGIDGPSGPNRHVGLHVLDGVRLSRLNNLGGSSVLYGLGVTSTEWAEQVGEGKGQVALDGLFNLNMHINWPVCLVWEAGWINHTELGKSSFLKYALHAFDVISGSLVPYTIDSMQQMTFAQKDFNWPWVALLLVLTDIVCHADFEKNRLSRLKYEFVKIMDSVYTGILYTTSDRQILPAIWTILMLHVVKLLFRMWVFQLADQSYRHGQNSRLVADYMSYEHELSSSEKPDPITTRGYKYLVYDEAKPENKLQPAPSDYLIELRVANEKRLITLEKVWQCQGSLLTTGDPDSRLKDLCLSFVLHKLIRRKFDDLQPLPKPDHEKAH